MTEPERSGRGRPFHFERWLDSVRGRTVELTTFEDGAERPHVLESRGDEAALHPAAPIRCQECEGGRAVMLVAGSRAETGACPLCGWSPGPTPD